MSDLYDADYWQAMDGGAGVQDSVMWQDIAFLLHNIIVMDPDGTDRAGEFRHIDVGCGYGYLVRHMRKRGFESFGLDLSKHALDSAPDDVKPHLRWFDLAWVDDSFFGRDAFQLVTCIEVLEHIPAEYARRALFHIKNLMAPGGYAFLAICVEGRPGAHDDPTHVNVVNRDWWENLFFEQKFGRDREMEDEFKRFHLFANHGGVFVLRKS